MTEGKNRSMTQSLYDLTDNSPLVRIYEAEQQLTPEDRVDLGNKLRRISMNSNYGAFGLATTAYFIPTMIYNYRNPGATQMNVNGKPVRSFFILRRPFFSVFLSVSTLLVSKLLLTAYMAGNASRSNENSRQKAVWDQVMLSPMAAGYYGEYLLRSANDELFRMKDPRVVAKELEENRNAVEYMPPVGIPTRPSDPNAPSNGEAWQHIREENGFPKKGSPQNTRGPLSHLETEEEAFNRFENSETKQENNDTETNSESAGNLSTWERIRKYGK